MRSMAIVLGAALLSAACGGASTQTTPASAASSSQPSAAPAAAAKLTFTADLKTTNEVPPVANDEKSGSGKATVTFDLTRDAAGTITAAKASIDASFSGFPATAAITIAHIHNAAAGANGGVVVPWKTDAGSPLTLTGGATTFKKADVTVDPALAQKIIDKPGDYYVNFHSTANPGGVVRGQLVKM